jgi:hypothetical protein
VNDSGVTASVLASVTADDSVMWRTKLADADGQYNWQIARFKLSTVALDTIRGLTFVWNGHGEPTPGYDTTVQTWNARTNSWSVGESGLFATDTDVSLAVSARDTTSMCLRCHDGLPPEGVVFPVERVALIAPSWTSASGDFHGAGLGAGFGITGLKPPYARSSGALQCAVCHDSHGSDSLYHIRATVNGHPVAPITDGNYTALCQACHTGLVRYMHEPCATSCHDATPDLFALLPTESSDCAKCHGHSMRWAHPQRPGVPGIYPTTF